MFTHALSLAALAVTASAVPILPSRDVADGCTSLGSGPLGFFASNSDQYNHGIPQYHLTFNNTLLNRYGDDYLLANSAYAKDNPEFFELISCKHTPPQDAGFKGSIDVYQGYIKTSDGNCIQRTSIDTTEGQFSKKPCAYSLNDLTGPSADQHFQFSFEPSFYNYYSIVFLGSEEGPTAQANTSFFSGGHYQLSALTLSQDSTKTFIEADYEEVEQQGYPKQYMIAHLGSQYNPSTGS